MYYEVDAWLKILAVTDPKTIRSFAEACWWAKNLVDAHYKILPRTPLYVSLELGALYRSGSQHYQRLKEVLKCRISTGKSNLWMHEISIDLAPKQLLDKRKEMERELEELLEHRHVTRVYVQRAFFYCQMDTEPNISSYFMETFKKMRAKTFYLQAHYYKNERRVSIGALGSSPYATLLAFKLVAGQKELNVGYGHNYGKMLFDIFTPRDCTEVTAVIDRPCHSDELIEFLKMFASSPTSTPRVEVALPSMEDDTTRIFPTLEADLRTSELLGHYNVRRSKFVEQEEDSFTITTVDKSYGFLFQRTWEDCGGINSTILMTYLKDL